MGVFRDLPEERRVLALPTALDALNRDEVPTIFISGLTQPLLCESPLAHIALLRHWAACPFLWRT